MTLAQQHVRINSPKVVGEVIDGEAVVINLENGNYYTMDRIGGEIWNIVEQNVTVESIVDAISARYEGSGLDIETSINELIVLMEQEGLIVLETEEAVDNAGEQGLLSGPPAEEEKIEFAPPVLQKYDDMQDLLLLDPIHDVDEMGWPNVKPDTTDV